MDASLVLAIDGVRVVASVAAEVIVAHGDGDRAQLVAAADVEASCNSALGISAAADDEAEAAEPAGRFGGFLQSLNQLPRLVGLGGARKDSGGADAAAAAAAAATDAAADASAAALKRAIAAAQLAPITDLAIVHTGDPTPDGYSRVEWSATGLYPADLNAVRALGAAAEGQAG